jgi:hypothetical protein
MSYLAISNGTPTNISAASQISPNTVPSPQKCADGRYPLS